MQVLTAPSTLKLVRGVPCGMKTFHWCHFDSTKTTVLRVVAKGWPFLEGKQMRGVSGKSKGNGSCRSCLFYEVVLLIFQQILLDAHHVPEAVLGPGNTEGTKTRGLASNCS